MNKKQKEFLSLATVAGIVLFIVAGFVLLLTVQAFQTQNELNTEFQAVHTVYLPSFYYNLNSSQSPSSGEPDMWIEITLTYRGTLVAGNQTFVILNGIAHTPYSSLNISSIVVGFQDSLVYPPQAPEAFRHNGSAILVPTSSNDFVGSGEMYFPIEGSYHPVVSVISKCGVGCARFYPTRVVDVATLQVQPQSRLEDEKVAIANLQLTEGLYIFDLVAFLGTIITLVIKGTEYFKKLAMR